MNIPNLKLFEWLQENSLKSNHVFAFSNIPGLTYKEYQKYTNFSIPSNFDLNKNQDLGAQELKDVLCSIYSCQPNNIVTSTGGSEANFLVFLSLLKPGDEVIVEKPGYEPLYITPKIFGAKTINWVRRIEDDFQINLEYLGDLITKKTRLIIMTNLHNPSGVLTSQKTIQQLSEFAEKKDIYLLIDEIFLDGAFNRQNSSYGLPNVIITSSMTKIYGIGGLRTGWIIAPTEVVKKCQKAKSHTTGCSPYISEIISSHLLKNAKNHILDSYKSLAKKNLAIVKKWILKNHHLLDWVEPHGGIVCFPKYKSNIPSVNLCNQLLNKYKVLVTPGHYFNLDGHFRLGYGCKTPILEEGLEKLTNGLENMI